MTDDVDRSPGGESAPMNGHGIQMCEYGYVHARCRCMDQTVIPIKCDNPGHQQQYKPKHAKEQR